MNTIEILTLIGLIMAIIGGIFAFFQWNKSMKIRRSEFINEIVMKLRTDTILKEFIYLIDYSENWYNNSFHGNQNKIEEKVDYALSFFSYICYLYEIGNIKKKEFKFFEYEIHRIAISDNVINYFSFFNKNEKNNVF